MIATRLAAKELAAAEESAAVNLRLYGTQCARTKAAEERAAEAEAQRDTAHAAAEKSRVEVIALTEALEKARDVAAGLRADNHELTHELDRLRPKGADPVTAPRGDVGEVDRLRGELVRTKRALAATQNLLAVAEGRPVQGTVVGGG